VLVYRKKSVEIFKKYIICLLFLILLLISLSRYIFLNIHFSCLSLLLAVSLVFCLKTVFCEQVVVKYVTDKIEFI